MTIYDVASAAGVSVATASRAVNGNGKEVWKSAAARASAIRKIAQDMGYRPDYRAKTLAAGSTRTIGMLYSEDVPFLANGYDAMWLAFSRKLIAAKYHLAFVHIDPLDPLSNPLLSNGLDAAMVYHAVPDSVRHAIESLDRPRVLVNSDATLSGTSCFVADDAGGARQAVDHLASLGHRSVGFVSRGVVGFEPHCSLRTRREAVSARCKELGLSFVDASPEVRDAPIDALVDRVAPGGVPSATAWVVYNSMIAFSLTSGLFRRGIDVPGRVSVVTFDDTPMAQDAIVPLTTLRTPMAQMGSLAADALLSELSGSWSGSASPGRTVVIAEELIVRSSTGPAPAV